MARGFRSVRGGRSQRRETAWIGIANNTNTISAASTAVLSAALNAAALALRPFTIIRTHFYFRSFSDQIATTEFYGTSVGMAVVSDQARAIGVTAVPTPVTDLESDLFFMYGMQVGLLDVGDNTGVSLRGVDHRIDSKAARKVNDDQDVVLVFETPAEVSSVITIQAGRMLLKLH